jgi:phosphoglycolate phosphatase-like HAD superfamily hydrolase
MSDLVDNIHLSRDVALVLFELLSRAAPTGAVRPVDSAEQRALWDLEAELERLLPEPLLVNYPQLLEAARHRLRDVESAQPPPQKLVAFVDVDDTLVRSAGSKRIPIPGVVQRVRDLHSAGARLYCWSTAGSEYAHAAAVELGIAECFVDCLAKPQLMVDDQPPSEWRRLVCLHPNQISSMSVDEIESAVSGAG